MARRQAVSVFRTAISRVNNRGDTSTRAVETELTVCPWPLGPQSKLTGEMIAQDGVGWGGVIVWLPSAVSDSLTA